MYIQKALPDENRRFPKADVETPSELRVHIHSDLVFSSIFVYCTRIKIDQEHGKHYAHMRFYDQEGYSVCGIQLYDQEYKFEVRGVV